MNFKNPINKLKEIKDNISELSDILNEGKNALLSPFKELEQETIAGFTNDLNMTEDEQLACKKIIKSHIDKGGMVGDIPIPGTGVVADLAVMVTMTVSMSKIFGISLNKELAQKIVMQAINNVGASYVIKRLIKEAIKIIPVVGKVVAAYINSKISNIVLNKIGWDIAKMLYMKKYGVEDKNVEAHKPCKSLLPESVKLGKIQYHFVNYRALIHFNCNQARSRDFYPRKCA